MRTWKPRLAGLGIGEVEYVRVFQETTQQGNTFDRTYSMSVHVNAVQDELPGGLERLMSILEGTITSRPVA